MSKENEAATGPDLVITRIFDAPRELVWKTWTDPEHVTRWWGPRAFTTPVVKIDFRVGGKFLACMKAEDGKEYWSTGTYKEIVPLEQIVCTDSFSDEDGNIVNASAYGMGDDWPDEMMLTVTFEDLGGKTRLTLRSSGMPAGKMDEMAGSGWHESLDKFAEALRECN